MDQIVRSETMAKLHVGLEEVANYNRKMLDAVVQSLHVWNDPL